MISKKEKIESLEHRVKWLEKIVSDLSTQLNCQHEPNKLQFDCDRRAGWGSLRYYAKCSNCGAIVKTFPNEEAMLHYQLELLRDRIANLPEDEKEEQG